MKKDSVWKIITEDLDMQKVWAKIDSRLLNDDQKEHCMLVYLDILNCLQTEPDLLCRIIIDDEACISEYDLETKCYNNQ